MRRPLVVLAILLAAGAARGQDLEARAAATGRALPQGYYERIARDPHFFEIRRGWKAKTTARTVAPFLVAPADLHTTPITGTLRLAVIPALFADSKAPDVSSAQIQSLWFDGPNPYGTTSQFYTEISHGLFTVTGSTTPWVRTSLNVAQVVGTSQGLGADARTGDYLVEALALADQYIDFSQFDNDGPDGIPSSGDDDGYVDAVAFEELDIPASCGGPGIWPHRSAISGWRGGAPYVTNDTAPNGAPIRIDDYILLSVHDCTGAPVAASVISHELGHILGLPDLYDLSIGLQPGDRRWIVGCWSLMSAGSWGCGDGAARSVTNRPTYDGPWERAILGWVDVTNVGSVAESTFVLPPAEEGGGALRVPLSANEYLLIENRKQESFDTDLPASGILIYQIDETKGFGTYSTSWPRYYRVALVEAEGDSSLRMSAAEGGDRGDAADAFARAGHTDSLSAVTVPVLKLHTGGGTTVSIDAMRIDAGGNAVITLSTAAHPVITLAPAAPLYLVMDSVEIPMRIAGGAQPYVWSLYSGTLPAGVTLRRTGRTAYLVGRALEAGTFVIQLQATDALNYTVLSAVTLNIGPVTLARDRVLQAYTGSGATPLTDLQKRYLDAQGNRNGKFDVGDLRAWLGRN